MARTRDRHDYSVRPAARWEDGYFVPPAPPPISKRIADWDTVDILHYLRAAYRNPLHAQTEVGMREDDIAEVLRGTLFYSPSSPAAMREAFVEKADSLRLSGIRNAILRPALRNGLLTTEGPRWRADRRSIAPVFTPRHVDGFADVMAQSTARSLERLFGHDTVALDEAFVDLTYNVLSDALFSGELDGGKTANLREIDRFLNSMGRPDPADMLGMPDWVPRVTKIGKLGAVRRLRRDIQQLVDRRRAGGSRDDLLGLMLDAADFTDETLQDQLITFIAAGHETTSRALTWMFYLLSQDTAARDRLEAEVDALDDSLPAAQWRDHLPWTRACFDEAMRLYPPAPFLSRELARDETLAGRDMPEGTIILGNIYMLHRHRLRWKRPDSFDPARFMPDRIATDGPIDRYAYLPFGIGQRVCIGARFAVLEAMILVARIARRYRFELQGEHPWPLARVTLRTERSMVMRVVRRQV